MRREEVYVVTDIEADGPVPGRYSMLSIGAHACLADGTKVGTFKGVLERMEGATTDPDTLEWWKNHPEAWEIGRSNPRPIKDVMGNYLDWVMELPGKPVFAAYPVTYDYMWTVVYLQWFTGKNPFGPGGLGIKTLAMAWAGLGLSESAGLANRTFERKENTHVPWEDAEYEAELMVKLLKALGVKGS